MFALLLPRLEQDTPANEVTWLKWKDSQSQEGEIKFGPTIFGDQMGAIGKEVENEAKEHAHQYDPQFSSQ
jgi:hypothetical protein